MVETLVERELANIGSLSTREGTARLLHVEALTHGYGFVSTVWTCSLPRSLLRDVQDVYIVMHCNRVRCETFVLFM